MPLEPYYDHAGITIYHGDCREILPDLKADVVVTDPPYGMAYQSGWRADSSVIGDGSPRLRDEVLTTLGDLPALVFGRWSVQRPRATKMVLYWDKGSWPGMGDLRLPWGPSTEEIYVIGSGFVGERTGQIIRCPRRNNGDHPTAKPVELMERLISACPPGIILDPFAGGGATLEASQRMSRRAIGIEIEERYCEIAAKRLAQEVLPFGEALRHE